MKRILFLLAAVMMLAIPGCKKGPAVESVTVIPDKVSLNPGEYKVLAVDIKPFELSGEAVAWSSNNEAVAKVSQSGRVTAVSAGEAVISAAVGGKIGTCNVTVLKIVAVDMGLPSGTLWGDRNVGASSPEDYGSYFAWGESEPKAEYNWGTYKWGDLDNITKYNFADGLTALKPEDDPATAEFGEGWRMPTADEWYELYSEGHWQWDDNKKGYTVLGDNMKGIFLPAAGVKPFEESEYSQPGVIGTYWTLTRGGDNPNAAMQAYFYSDYVVVATVLRKPGSSIRPVYAPRVGVTGISMNKPEINTIPGSVHQLIAVIEPSNATEQGVLWTSSDESVAIVDAFGMVTILAEGTANIQAATVDGSELATSCPITVTAPKNLTVYDGETTNGYVPIYGFYADAYLKCEMVYPATQLVAMKNATINSLVFYAAQTDLEWGTQYRVFLKEVESPGISAFSGTDGATIVYEGPLSIVEKQLIIPFTTGYTYGGRNLLVGIYQINTGSYKTSTWYGQTVDGACVQGYSYSSLSDVGATQRSFLPKTTFNF